MSRCEPLLLRRLSEAKWRRSGAAVTRRRQQGAAGADLQAASRPAVTQPVHAEEDLLLLLTKTMMKTMMKMMMKVFTTC